MSIVSSKTQTKQWRIQQNWYKNGKSNECELYQKRIIEEITDCNIEYTNARINQETLIIEKINNPLTLKNGFEYTENFDGYVEINNKKIYLNLKFICGFGGSQTRSLRETYHFIKVQYKVFENKNHIYVANILDGDECYKRKKLFRYLQKNHNNNHIFIGDMKKFKKWFLKINQKT